MARGSAGFHGRLEELVALPSSATHFYRWRAKLLVFLRLLVVCTEVFLPLVVGVLRQCPFTGRRSPGLGQHYGVVNGDLVDEVVFRGTREALDHALLLAVQPCAALTRETHGNISQPSIDIDRLRHQGVSFIVSGCIAIESGIGIFVVRTPSRVYHANGQRVFRQKDHHSGLRHQHDRAMLILLYGYGAWGARLIANSVRDRALVFCLHPRLEDRALLRRRLAIVLPEYAWIHRISALQHSSRAVGIITS